MRLYLAGPLFSEAERVWLDALAARLRAEGFECFVPHENFPSLADVTLEDVYRVDAGGLRSANALVAWLDGPMVDDGTACEIGMFAELVQSGGEQYREDKHRDPVHGNDVHYEPTPRWSRRVGACSPRRCSRKAPGTCRSSS